MRLRERHLAKVQTPGFADAPMGSGPANRHGMPKLPPGQHEVSGWPVLDLGRKPEVAVADWRLELSGACANPVTLDWQGLLELPMITDVSDFHCVTTWSRYDMEWRGVRFLDLAVLAQMHDDATVALCHGYDGYTTNVPLVEALKDDVLIAIEANGEPMPIEHGGPARMITPQLYAWKGTKWINKIEFLIHDKKGYWEQRGYSNSAHPWREDRYG